MINKTMTEVVYETVKGLHKIGLVDQMTMHEFDALCLPKIRALRPKKIKKIARPKK